MACLLTTSIVFGDYAAIQVWCGDVTYIWTGKRWAYLAVVLETQAGRWPSAMVIGIVLVLSYLMPRWQHSWARDLERTVQVPAPLPSGG